MQGWTHQLRMCPFAPSCAAPPKHSSSSIDWPPEKSCVTQPLLDDGMAGNGTSRMTGMVSDGRCAMASLARGSPQAASPSRGKPTKSREGVRNGSNFGILDF
jgi:hypothetical protein